MSNYLAVATVTATLATKLHRAAHVVDGATVTFERPDQLEPEGTTGEAGINVYLYRVQIDPSFRNMDLPTRGLDGTLEQLPVVALDLDYLVTLYGDDSRFEPQLLLGATESVLHEEPVLTRHDIERALHAYPALEHSTLAAQPQHVTLTPISLTLDELSRVWSVFVQAPYLLSVVYRASVVLISPEQEPPVPALPVRHRRIHVYPFGRPVITQVAPREAEVGSELMITGRNFSTDPVDVLFSRATIRVEPEGTTRITCEVPRELRAGLNSVIVALAANIGTPGDPDLHPLARSNVASFVLRPTILAISYYSPSSYQRIDPPVIAVTASPHIGPDQLATLWLEEILPDEEPAATGPGAAAEPAQPRVYGLQVLAFHNPTATVHFDAAPVAPGTYLARLRVDDSESRANPADRVIVP